MKKIYFIILLFFLGHGIFANDASTRSVWQEIRYEATGANEVWLVWGVNGWQAAPKEFWPAGTYLKDKLLYSPMKKQEGYFSARILAPKNTMIDYVFWISKGFRNAPADIWDINTAPEKDYHTLALINSAMVIESTVKAMPREMLSILDYAIPLTVVLCALFLIYLFYLRKKISVSPGISYANIIASSSATLFLFLVIIRTSITRAAWDIYHDPLHNMESLLKPSFHDFIFVLAITLIFWLPALGFSRFSQLQKGIAFAHSFFCLLFLVMGLLNIRIVEALGKPFTYQWLYYSDFLNSADAKAALASNIDRGYILQLCLVSVSAVIFAYLLMCANKLAWRSRAAKLTALACTNLAACIYIFYAVSSKAQNKWDINKLQNPVTAFLESVNPLSSAPELFTMHVADSLQYDLGQKKPNTARSSGKIKNVVLFVLESTPAEYISAYHSKYNVTPELSKYLSNALVFKNIYAHAPATNNSMVSLLGSIYPMISYATLTQKNPGMAMPTLSSELKKKNYKTAFFNSADNRFQRTGEFLAHRNFDVIKDCRDHTQFKVHFENSKFLDGGNDQNTAEDMMRWIGQNKTNPFFTMMWTYQTHYPYFSAEEETTYEASDPVFNRYLNAVHHSDKVFGQLMEYLKANDLYESTLVVLVGDHGEAFGRHGQTTHASHIYEENLHVPCIFLNPAFKSKEHEGLGGLIDIAPTIMSLLNEPAPVTWQGKDLFTANIKDRVYFFSSWSDYLFGYREGTYKYIFNATRNLTEVYDLESDPLETNNVVGKVKTPINISHQRMAGWVQAVNHFMEERVKEDL